MKNIVLLEGSPSPSINVLNIWLISYFIGLEKNKNFGISFNDDENLVMSTNNNSTNDLENENDINNEKGNVKYLEQYIACAENTKIKACLTTVDELYNLSKFISNFHDNFDLKSPNKFILVIRNKKSDCVHK